MLPLSVWHSSAGTWRDSQWPSGETSPATGGHVVLPDISGLAPGMVLKNWSISVACNCKLMTSLLSIDLSLSCRWSCVVFLLMYSLKFYVTCSLRGLFWCFIVISPKSLKLSPLQSSSIWLSLKRRLKMWVPTRHTTLWNPSSSKSASNTRRPWRPGQHGKLGATKRMAEECIDNRKKPDMNTTRTPGSTMQVGRPFFMGSPQKCIEMS